MRSIIVICCLLGINPLYQAQDYMRIHHKGGRHSDVDIEQVDSITFVKGDDTPTAEVSLMGNWIL